MLYRFLIVHAQFFDRKNCKCERGIYPPHLDSGISHTVKFQVAMCFLCVFFFSFSLQLFFFSNAHTVAFKL